MTKNAAKRNSIRVLIIEDNPGDVRLIQEVLKDTKGICVELKHAETLSKGAKIANQEKQDVILLDLNLPDSQGLGTISQTASKMKDIPIVVLTGGIDATKGVEALQAGAEDYLIKGKIDADTLSRAIRYAIERYRLKKAEIEFVRQKEQLKQEQRFIERMDNRLEEKGERVSKKKLTKEIAEDISLKYIKLLEVYTKYKDLENEEKAVTALCLQFIEYGITPKGIIGIHLKAAPQLKTLSDLETRRITFEVRMVLLAVITKYAELLQRQLTKKGGV